MKRILDTLIDLYPNNVINTRRCYQIAKEVSTESTKEIDNALKQYAENSISSLYKDTFEVQKKELISEIRKIGFWGFGDALAKRINEFKDPIKFLQVFKNLAYGISFYMDKQFNKLSKKQTIDFQNPKIENRIINCFKELNLSFYRFITPQSTNPKVKKIEESLKELGIKEVRLGNDETLAQLTYNAIQIAKSNNDKLPDRIFTPLFPETITGRCEGTTISFGDDERIIFLAPTKLKNIFNNCKKTIEKKLETIPAFNNISDDLKNLTRRILYIQKYSTSDPRRVILHEIGHVNDVYNFPRLKIQDLATKDKNTINNLTQYIVTDNILGETFAELYAKIRAEGFESLTKNEKNLYNRMISGYFDNYEVKKQSISSKILNFFKKLFNE